MTPPAPRPVALIGWGKVAQTFYGPALAAQHALQVVAVVDADPAQRAAGQAAFPAARAAASPAELGAAPVDGVALNLTPAQAHLATNRELLSLGWHTYSEKPAAPGAHSWEQLCSQARGAGRALVSAPTTAFGPAARALQELVRSGALGRPMTVHVEVALGGPAARRPLDPRRGWFLRPGSGVVSDIGLYGIAHTVALFGPPERVAWRPVGVRLPIRVAGASDEHAETVAGAASPDAWTAALSWSDGLAGTMHIGYRPGRTPVTSLEVHGTERSVALDIEDVHTPPVVLPADGVTVPAVDPHPDIPAGQAKYLQALQFLVRCLDDPGALADHQRTVHDTLALAAVPLAREHQGVPAPEEVPT
ncbi:Gfo/Idh/MocA family protein [Streptomyces sp. NPDC054770]